MNVYKPRLCHKLRMERERERGRGEGEGERKMGGAQPSREKRPTI